MINCRICGDKLIPKDKRERTILFLHRGEQKVEVHTMKCMVCKRHTAEEIEEAPVGSRFAWDVIERIVLLRKSGKKPKDIRLLLKTENQLSISGEGVRRIIKTYGPGTLDQ